MTAIDHLANAIDALNLVSGIQCVWLFGLTAFVIHIARRK